MSQLHTWALPASIVIPAVVARLAGRRRSAAPALARTLRDLVTLRMVLRDTEPAERTSLLHAHRSWRDDPADTGGHSVGRRR